MLNVWMLNPWLPFVVLLVLSSWLDLTESFLPAENFLFSIHGFCIWEILYAISLKKVMCNQQLLIIYPPMSYFQKTADTGMQLLHQKSSDTAAAVSVAGGNEKTLFFGVHDIGSMSTPNRRHRSLAPFWILEGILERLIEGVKRQQLRSTIFSYLHSRIPIESVWQDCSLSLISLLTSTPQHQQSTSELCVFYLWPLVDHIRIGTP